MLFQEAPSVGDLVKVTMELSDGRDLATHMFDLGLAAPDEGMEPEVVVAPPTGIPKRTVSLVTMWILTTDLDIGFKKFFHHKKEA